VNTDPSPPRPTEQQLISAIAALDPEARARVERVLDAQLEPGPRDWTSTGRELGIDQAADPDGYIHAVWPKEVWRNHRVYFIQAGEPDEKGFATVKIGFSTDVDKRLRQLQTASASPLKLLECAIGTQAIEGFIHRVLRHRHLRGEWFRIHPDDISYALACMMEEGISAW
jgi:hypothetical protein